MPPAARRLDHAAVLPRREWLGKLSAVSPNGGTERLLMSNGGPRNRHVFYARFRVCRRWHPSGRLVHVSWRGSSDTKAKPSTGTAI
jgi:hypothetical protein